MQGVQRHPAWPVDLQNMQHAPAPAAFSLWLEKRKVKRNDGKARCNACKREEEAEERNVAEGSRAEVQDMRD